MVQTFQASTSSNEESEAVNLLQGEIQRLKRFLHAKNYNSNNYSPVKREEAKVEVNVRVNGTTTRNRKHYFKLKGCEKTEEVSGKEN